MPDALDYDGWQDDLEALRHFRQYPDHWIGQSITTEGWEEKMAAVDRLIAAIDPPPPPPEPSEAAITAYCEAHGWRTEPSSNRTDAATDIKAAAERGYDLTPRRLDAEPEPVIDLRPTEEQVLKALAFLALDKATIVHVLHHGGWLRDTDGG